MKKERIDKRNALLFNCFALILQKYFRGYYSRKYRNSHYRRKLFIKNLIEKTSEIRDAQYEYSIQQALREERERKETTDASMRKLTEGLHHLLSTTQIRGVFNPPPEFLSMPTMKEIPVEEHLRGATRDLLRTRGYTKSSSTMVPDYNGTLRIPFKGLKAKLSLQASAPYDAIEKQKKSDLLLHNIISTDRQHKFFVSGGKTNVINPKFEPLSAGDIFVDVWNNPLLIRGVPQSQKQLLESAVMRKALFAPPPAKPFVSGHGNMSNVAPTTFDAIGEAQSTGGVVRRHLGTTLRLGVPDNCDYRPEDGVAPTIPPRSSSLRQTRPNIKRHRISVQSIINSAKLQVGENLAILQLRQKLSDNLRAAKAEDPLASSDDEETGGFVDEDSQELYAKDAVNKSSYAHVQSVGHAYVPPSSH